MVSKRKALQSQKTRAQPAIESQGGHTPVMLHEVVAALAPSKDDILVDGTFGRGGYSCALLKKAECRVIGIDRDPSAIAFGEELSKDYDGRLTLKAGTFGQMDELLGDQKVDGVTLDLGVSSPQLDDPERGFSFREDGPLDMRMSRSGQSAADLVNTLDEESLANIIYRLGEERRSRQVAAAIVIARKDQPITRTGQLASIVRSVVRASKDGIDPATRTFQGLRLHVNDELGELERGLEAAERILAPGGRLAVVSFHSLEDRIVKLFLRERSGADPKGSRHLPSLADSKDSEETKATFTTPGRSAIKPGKEECRDNPRARSARLRVAVRTTAPARAEEGRA
ncbi:16S rRNA (cytosine(1402)-N(4))-methyltransferase RsmH [Rhodovibrionaceae bacterium A322]